MILKIFYHSEALFLLAVCHTIIIEEKNDEVVYNASSPDELALVNFARFCGVEYLGINSENCMIISYKNKKYEYKLLHILQFNSTRKRMSIIVKNPDNQIVLYCKGADSIVMERLDHEK